MKQQEIRLIEEELEEIRKFENMSKAEDVLTFSESCGGFITLICC